MVLNVRTLCFVHFFFLYSMIACTIVQGLLHLLNESGYPNHEGYEASASIQLCSDLLLTSSGFFYTNDMHVRVSMISGVYLRVMVEGETTLWFVLEVIQSDWQTLFEGHM